eukprot:2937655-Prymnesium_polylepis.2
MPMPLSACRASHSTASAARSAHSAASSSSCWTRQTSRQRKTLGSGMTHHSKSRVTQPVPQ